MHWLIWFDFVWFDWLIYWLIYVLVDCLFELFVWLDGIDWLSEWIEWLIDWLIDWLIGWLSDWLIDLRWVELLLWMVALLKARLVYRIDRLIEWLLVDCLGCLYILRLLHWVDRLVDWIDWLVDWQGVWFDLSWFIDLCGFDFGLMDSFDWFVAWVFACLDWLMDWMFDWLMCFDLIWLIWLIVRLIELIDW